jgi:hypothetical protein
MNRVRVTLLLLVAVVTGCTVSAFARIAGFVHTPGSRGSMVAGRHHDTAPTPDTQRSRAQLVQPHGKNSVPPSTNISLLTGTQLSAGAQAFSAAVTGDFNGDSKKDAVVMVSDTSGLSFSVSAMLGNGDGTFAAAVLTAASYDYADRILVGDLNADGKDDLVLVHSGPAGGSFDVLISNGDGTFATPVNYADGYTNPAAALIRDLNGDGKLDLILADGFPSADNPDPPPATVSTWLGNGDGSLQAPTQVQYPGPVAAAVLVDVNGDEALDVVGDKRVFLSDGEGGYLAGVALVPPSGQTSTCADFDDKLAVGNVNGDVYPDIVVADCDDDTVSVYLNNGDGSFQQGVSYWAGYFPQGVGIADLNGDGHVDILSANANGSDVTVLIGNGDGTFQTPTRGYSAGGYPWTKPLIADFNNDAKYDLLVTNYLPDVLFAVTSLPGFGDGTFAAAIDYFSPATSAANASYGIGLASADFNSDGQADYVLGTSGPSGAGVVVFLGDSGTGVLLPGVNYGTSGTLNYVATGDFDQDGTPDIVASDAASGDIELFLGNGDGTFQAAQTFTTGAAAGQGLVAGDFNHDNWPDVAMLASSASVIVLLNDTSGAFLAGTSYSITNAASEIKAADLDEDGNLDLVAPQHDSNFVSILKGNSNGTFSSLSDFDLGSSYPLNIAVGDLNADGHQDLAVTIDDFNAGMGIAVALGNGDGSFQSATLYPTTQSASNEPYPAGVQIVDLDQDGHLDLVYDNSHLGTVGILFGVGDGTFYSAVEFPAGGYPYELLMADVNGDGAADVVTAGDSFPGVTVLLNTGGNRTTLGSSLNPSTVGDSVTFTSSVSAAVRGVSATPSGAVTFSDGGSVLGTASLSGGEASITVSSLEAGAHQITATYSGNSFFVSSSSSPLNQTVTSGGSPSDYWLSANPTSATISLGQDTVFAITVHPVNGYRGNVAFACGSLPQGVSCLFQPASVNLSSDPIQVQLAMSAAANLSSIRYNSRHPLLRGAGLGGGLFFGLVLMEGVSRRRRSAVAILGLLLIAVLSLSLVGCGGATADSSSTQAASNAHSVRVIAVGPDSRGGSQTHQVNITVTIQE